MPYPYNNYPYNYNPVNAYQNQLAQGMPAPAQHVEVIKVNGENGAKAYQMAPNSSILLLDETAPLVWLKTTDGAGYPTITPYSIAPYKAEPPVDVKSLEQRISRIEGILNEKSNFRKPERTPDDAGEHRTD